VVSALWSSAGELIVSGMQHGCQLLTCGPPHSSVFPPTQPDCPITQPSLLFPKPQEVRPGGLAKEDTKVRKKPQSLPFSELSLSHLHMAQGHPDSWGDWDSEGHL
jgi:hypothetical protein